MKALLDGNVYDALEKESASAALLGVLVMAGKVEILMTRVVREELAARPAGMPALVPVTEIADGVAVAGLAESAQQGLQKARFIRATVARQCNELYTDFANERVLRRNTS